MKQYFLYALLLLTVVSCSKDKLLNEKPSSEVLIPETLNDCQALLGDFSNMNDASEYGEISSDDYYIRNFNNWNNLPSVTRNAHIWGNLYVQSNNGPDWNRSYRKILIANVVLETLDRMPVGTTDQTQWKLLKGSALFYRAFFYHNLSQVYCLAYDPASANKDLGVPLKLSGDINKTEQRATLQQTYDRIISDLTEAKILLPETVNTLYLNRPSKPAAHALLSRVYLTMRNYNEALDAAEASLSAYNYLMDYNTEFLQTSFFHKEVIWNARLSAATNLFNNSAFNPNTIVDSTLFRSYLPNDLRRTRYFSTVSGQPVVTNLTYSGYGNAFGGLATDELYLTKAECLARAGKISESITILNTLLQKRFSTGTFIPAVANNQNEAMTVVLNERRKELCFRGLRWMDVRRLNKEGYNIVMRRTINNVEYKIEPNSLSYALLIPPDEIQRSGIVQNPR